MIEKIKKTFPLLILIGVVLFAAKPLLTSGFIPTHDGEYHLIRFYEFERMLRAGHWFPRWAPGLNSGYGLPLFNFFYPFPNYLGAVVHSLGWSLVESFKLILAMGYLTATAFCYFWLKKLFNTRSAITGTIVFAFVPYWFVDLYVRGSVGEVLAIMWFMVFLVSFERRWSRVVCISVSGIILSHNILSMVFVPLSVAYGFLRHRRYILETLLGIGLTTYFWLPALLERQYVIGLNVVNFREHFSELFQLLIPSWGTGFSTIGIPNGEMSQQIGVVTVLTGIWAILLIFREKERKLRRLIGGGLLLFVLTGSLILGISQPLWEIITPLQLLQYPWRFLSVMLPLSGLFAAYVVSKSKGNVWSIVLGFIAIAVALGYIRPVTYEPRDDGYYLSRREFTDGTSSLGNSFSTIWSPWIRGVSDEDPMNLRFTIASEKEATVRVNTAYYPGWTAVVDGKTIAIDYQKDGTITFLVSGGEHSIRVFFSETPMRRIADLISLISLFWIVLSGILRLHAYRHQHHAS